MVEERWLRVKNLERFISWLGLLIKMLFFFVIFFLFLFKGMIFIYGKRYRYVKFKVVEEVIDIMLKVRGLGWNEKESGIVFILR